MSFMCPMLRYLPGDLFQIKKKACLYRRIRDSFVLPAIDERLGDSINSLADDFISAYLLVVGSLEDEETKDHVNGTAPSCWNWNAWTTITPPRREAEGLC